MKNKIKLQYFIEKTFKSVEFQRLSLKWNSQWSYNAVNLLHSYQSTHYVETGVCRLILCSLVNDGTREKSALYYPATTSLVVTNVW